MKNIFITGGAGFIANTLISKLIDTHNITVYDNFERDTLSSSKVYNHKNLTIVKGDVLDYDTLLLSMKTSNPNIVIHAAAIAGIDNVINHPVKTMRVNMLGTANVLEACKQLNIPDRIIDFSTSEVFGSMAFKSKEDDVPSTRFIIWGEGDVCVCESKGIYSKEDCAEVGSSRLGSEKVAWRITFLAWLPLP